MDWTLIGCGIGCGFLWMIGAVLAMALLCALAMRALRGRISGGRSFCCMGHGAGGHHHRASSSTPPASPGGTTR